MRFTNQQVADILHSVATSLTIKKKNIFEIKAYENAATAIEHLTGEAQDLGEEGRLDEIPGVGKSIQAHLEELFKKGKVKHFEELEAGIPKGVFELIKIPGVGPKTAMDLAALGAESVKDLQKMIKTGELIEKGFSPKLCERVMSGIEEYNALGSRMLLSTAVNQAEKIIEYLKKSPDILEADALGSLRRRVATVGDLDFSVSSKNIDRAIEWFTKMPGVAEVISRGPNKAMVRLSSGLHVDLLAGPPESYGALLQHFTGSKQHNIHLRTRAEKKGLSLSEDGVTKVTSDNGQLTKGKTIPCKTEEQLYKLMDMQTPDPEIREDTGEIEAAIAGKLPKLVKFEYIKGDMHLHSNFPFKSPSHAPGADSLEEIIEQAIKYGYEYVGISDHAPGFTALSKEEIIKEINSRNKKMDLLKKKYISSTKSIRVLNALEIDVLPNGTLSVPDEGLANLDYCIAGIHSSHHMKKEEMTKRILKALSSPHVDILAHPTGRILNERTSYEADWAEIFKYCAENHKLLEIDGYPNRLDLRDDLVKLAVSFGCKFTVDTDAHAVFQMENMPFGVSVARRGWATKEDIVNTWDWKKVADWFKIST